MNPQKKARRKDRRERRLFLRATTDAMSPYVAAIVATTSRREVRCVGTSDPSRNLQAVVCRPSPDSSTDFAGRVSLASVRNQIDCEALAICRAEAGGPGGGGSGPGGGSRSASGLLRCGDSCEQLVPMNQRDTDYRRTRRTVDESAGRDEFTNSESLAWQR
jgi:hypothetical protein